jgi:hypothetical protein
MYDRCVPLMMTTVQNNMQGIWSGMIGGTLMQTLILVWVTFRTNWEKEVCTNCASCFFINTHTHICILCRH